MNDRRREVIASGRELEDSFFLKQDRDLIDKLKTLRRLEETRDALAEASGIRDQAVLQKLVELGVRPESVAPLALVPIVEVAWADGEVDEKERKAVLDAADSRGIRAGDLQHGLLRSWLSHRPSTELFEAWQHYVAGLCAQLGQEQRDALRGEVLDRARAVAEASGGFLGLGSKVSPRERAVLQRLEGAFVVP
jgi:hypothetical protein